MTTIQDYQDKNKHNIKYYRKQMSKYLLTYNQIKEGIQFKEEDIKNLEKEYFEVCPAVHKINKSSSQWTIEDKRKYMADKIKAGIVIDKLHIKQIERCLLLISKDKYYDIIPLFYFENNTIEAIAEKLFCDVKTIYRNKKRLLDKMIVCYFGVSSILK